MSSQPTATAQLLDRILREQHGVTLAAYVERHRGAGTSWVRIAEQLRNLTGLSVSLETVRQWYLTSRMPGTNQPSTTATSPEEGLS